MQINPTFKKKKKTKVFAPFPQRGQFPMTIKLEKARGREGDLK